MALTKIDVTNINKLFPYGCIYDGSFDSSNANKLINIPIENNLLLLDLTNIEKSRQLLQTISKNYLTEICSLSGIQMTEYDNGNISLRKHNSTEELTSCYLFSLNSNGQDYLACIAFDEVQPTIYRAEIVSLFEIH